MSYLQFGNFGGLERHGFVRNKFWSYDEDPSPLPPANKQSSVDLILKSTEDDLKTWPHRCVLTYTLIYDMDVLSVLSTITSLSNFILPRCYWRSFELRFRISISPGKLTLIPRVRNIDSKAFSFMFALRNYLYVSDIRCVFLSNFFAPDFLLLYCFLSLSDILCGYRTCSEVRVEGLETLDYLDNLIGKERFTEQADAITFDGEVSNVSHCKVFKEEKKPHRMMQSKCCAGR